MKSYVLLLTILGIFLFAFSSGPVKDDVTKLNNSQQIPRNKYYIADYMPAEYSMCYGNWKAVSTSGGYNGKGFVLDFDHLILKKNGIFAITQNDSMIAYGKLVLVKNKGMLNCKFVFDKKARLELANDVDKYIQLTHMDTLVLEAPCCDRYTIKLARVHEQ